MNNSIRMRALTLVMLCAVLGLSVFSCSKDYDNISTENGRNALIEKANGFLSSGKCEEARTTLEPLYSSAQHSTSRVKLIYASTYACDAGFSFSGMISVFMNTSGSDIWSSLVKTNYSISSTDQKVSNMLNSATIIRKNSIASSTSTAYYNANTRDVDSNLLMMFVQLSIVHLTISTSSMGDAIKATGHKTRAITGLGSTAELCQIAHAFYTVKDCLNNMGSATLFTNISNTLNTICSVGGCSGSKDPSVCTVTEQNDGTAFIAAIDSVWSF